ncbi:MAG: beta-galactosidase domain 4-containing protein, partial [Anaerolineales bacterium]
SFLANGILTADRQPHPHAFQVKHSYQPVSVQPLDLLNGKIAIKNKNWFETTSKSRLHWELAADGVVTQLGQMDCPEIPPQDSAEVQLLITIPEDRSAEYHLKLSFRLKHAAPWAPAGFEVAWEQFPLPILKPEQLDHPPQPTGYLSLEQSPNSVRITGKDFSLEFDPRCGAWSRYCINGIDYFLEPLLPNFWRVPLDNDGDALLVNLRLPKFITRLLLPWTRWKSAAAKRKLRNFEVVQLGEDHIQVQTSFKIPGGRTPLELTYSIFGNGQVEVGYRFIPRVKLLRAGMQTQIPANFQQVTWFGRGPHESMLDRKSGYAVGIYNLDIEDFIHNYVRPQENANRSDVRWARFTDQDGLGLEIQSTSEYLLNFSVWPYSMADLEEADHIHELPRRDFLTLNIEYAQKGVGDLTSAFMGMPDEAQLLPGNPCEFSFCLKPIF